MDARPLVTAALLVTCTSAPLSAATVKSANFVVTAPTQEFAQQVSKAAEIYRHELAIEWLGQALPGNWSSPCPIKCKVGQIGAGGATTFTFNGGEVYGWHMTIQGTEERILDSVLPHEISHMIFASYFRRPLPRWADEGAATLVEHESERLRQTKLLDQVIRTSKRIPLRQLLSIKEYPQDMHDVLTLYAEGYSLADYLVQQKGSEGKTIYLKFLDDAHRHGWDKAFGKHYDTTVDTVEKEWTGWVMAGSPPITPAAGTLVASVDSAAAENTPAGMSTPQSASAAVPDGTIVRGQSADEPTPLPEVGRPRRTESSTAPVQAPRPQALAAVDNAEPSANLAPARIPGERRLTAQPPQPTTLLDQLDTLSHPREMPVIHANPRTATGIPSREDSFGPSQPNSFDAPTGVAADTMSPAPIAAANTSRGSALNGLGPDSAGGHSSPDTSGGGRTPSHRGFTSGRGGPAASSRGLFSP